MAESIMKEVGTEPKIAMVEVRRFSTHGEDTFCLMPLRGFSLEDELVGEDDGNVITLTYREMTKAEIDALPEFGGW